MTIIANDDFWMVWIIQLIFDVVILLILILREPTRESRNRQNHPDNWIEAPNVTQSGNPGDAIANRPNPDRFGWERRDAS